MFNTRMRSANHEHNQVPFLGRSISFMDDVVSNEGVAKLQKEIGQLGRWARKWSMEFQPVKEADEKGPCFIYFGGNGPRKYRSIKYLGVTITNDLRWNTHVGNICTKANRTIGKYACS